MVCVAGMRALYFFFFFFIINFLFCPQLFNDFDSSIFFFNFYFIYLWLCWVFVSVRGLSLAAASGGHFFIAVHGPLSIAASLLAEHRLQTRRLSNCGSRAQLLRGMWDLPRPGLEPVSPALAGRLPTTAPPGKPSLIFLYSVSPLPARAFICKWHGWSMR